MPVPTVLKLAGTWDQQKYCLGQAPTTQTTSLREVGRCTTPGISAHGLGMTGGEGAGAAGGTGELPARGGREDPTQPGRAFWGAGGPSLTKSLLATGISPA